MLYKIIKGCVISDIMSKFYSHTRALSRAVVLKLGSPDVPGLQLPEIVASTTSGEGFWELQSKNIWGPQFENHWFI